MNPQEFNEEPPIFQDLTTRAQLAKTLNVTTRSIANYHSLALDCVDDYYSDFPTVLKTTITNFRLSKYQCWVLWRLKQLIDTTKNSNLIKQSLINDIESQKLLSKATFLTEYPQDEQDEYKGIRRRA